MYRFFLIEICYLFYIKFVIHIFTNGQRHVLFGVRICIKWGSLLTLQALKMAHIA